MNTGLLGSWQNPAHPLYMAAAFQVLIFLLVVLTDWSFAASVFAGGTVGCIVASLRLQKTAVR